MYMYIDASPAAQLEARLVPFLEAVAQQRGHGAHAHRQLVRGDVELALQVVELRRQVGLKEDRGGRGSVRDGLSAGSS